MSVIQFDVLVPPAAAGEVNDAFQRALDILVRREMLSSGTVGMQRVLIDDSVRAQLAETYERDRGESPDDAEVHRYRIEVDGADSLNGLAILANRAPIRHQGRVIGAIATFRDKSEVNALAEQLTGVSRYIKEIGRAHV